MAEQNSPHTFYIPVMGTGFTLDSPLFVAQYGITSVISLVDDLLLEKMRRYWCAKSGEPYTAILPQTKDGRAKRITAYLNLIGKLVSVQFAKLKRSAFTPQGEIVRYFELLPPGELKTQYNRMVATTGREEKLALQQKLRQAIGIGAIDVNIMTKLDGQNYYHGEGLPYKFNDAAAALRGYAESNLNSTVVFSAGFNPQLYNYLTQFNDFFPDAYYNLKKKICLKVSDYRSALIQGKYLARRGLWVSEYRIESALNCGGHAFINSGQLLGPILEEFRHRKEELVTGLHQLYQRAMAGLKRFCAKLPPRVKITAQGGVGTNSEHELLRRSYGVDAVGWGSPFLLVPEATNVDRVTLAKLMVAEEDEIFLSTSSPLGIPFWNLRNSRSEEQRRTRIKEGVPGSPCIKGYTKLDQEFTAKPICRASREYQKLKLVQLAASKLTATERASVQEELLSKACICHELGGGILQKNRLATKIAPAICPGPNIINFRKLATLKEMVDHIYGRCSLLGKGERLHMLLRELQLQLNYLLSEAKNSTLEVSAKSAQKLLEIKEGLNRGIAY